MNLQSEPVAYGRDPLAGRLPVSIVTGFLGSGKTTLAGLLPSVGGTVRAAESLAAGAEVRVVRAACVGRCSTAPVVEVGHNMLDHATRESVLAAVAAGDTHPHVPEYQSRDAYAAAGGYAVLERLRGGELSPDTVLEVLEAAGLRGLGGAGVWLT